MAAHMINSGKNGVSAHEIHRTIGVTYKTAWFMMHRLREAMSDLIPRPMGGKGKAVQADETYYGNTSKRAKGYKKGHSIRPARCPGRGKGRVRAFMLRSATRRYRPRYPRDERAPQVELLTDESRLYT